MPEYGGMLQVFDVDMSRVTSPRPLDFKALSSIRSNKSKTRNTVATPG